MSVLDESFFRHAHGRLVAMLARRVGVEHLERVEDAVQHALVVALETWPRAGTPENPSGWLMRVAQRTLFGELRASARRAAIGARHLDSDEAELPEATLVADVRDDLLRMLFACCDEAIPLEAQLVLALKVLCGFEVREIAERLFVSEANVYKRLTRAKARLRDCGPLSLERTTDELVARLPVVRLTLYVLFSEGHLSSHPDGAIRRELCDEAIRLATELAAHPLGADPETFALLALMHLHRARLSARQDGSGGLLLLEEQDRSRWDAGDIALGLTWLARSAAGDRFSRHHAEAGIAAEHCLAPTFAATRWDRIVACYALLQRAAPSALHTLNHALALAELEGPRAGLALLDGLVPPSWLAGSHSWFAVLADLHRRAGDDRIAAEHRAAALAAAPSAAVRLALERRLA